ncbi:uncharacterized protein [Dermacentor albipictus]|uniref:uncharacterized protein isoform X1 n=1 Tax=Dermacentor albipictus TaxID=60249 RepID=UPI0038FC27DB
MCPRIVAGSFRQRLTLLLYHRFMAIPVSGITASERTAIRRTPCDQIFSGLGGTNNNEAFKMRSAYIFQTISDWDALPKTIFEKADFETALEKLRTWSTVSLFPHLPQVGGSLPTSTRRKEELFEKTSSRIYTRVAPQVGMCIEIAKNNIGFWQFINKGLKFMFA